MTTTVATLEAAYEAIRAAGYTPISMAWNVERGIPVDGVSSVETYGRATYNHPKMYVRIRQGG